MQRVDGEPTHLGNTNIHGTATSGKYANCKAGESGTDLSTPAATIVVPLLLGFADPAHAETPRGATNTGLHWKGGCRGQLPSAKS